MPLILVVDDNPAITGVLRRGLAYEGFGVAVNGGYLAALMPLGHLDGSIHASTE